MPPRARWRRLRLGLPTVLGLRPGGFLIPYRHAADVEPGAYPALEPVFSAAEPTIRGLTAAIEGYASDLLRIAQDDGPARFDQDWFPRLDAAAAYALVRRERPARIVEVGSGHSTRFLARAVVDGGLATAITCVDPAPRASLACLPGVRHVRALFQDADPALFRSLAPGDMLFIDSSHVAMPGTDVDRLVLDVMPRLPAGVLVHLHDIFLPEAYPPAWAWRGYNEQALAGALLTGRGYDLVFASRWVVGSRPAWLREGVLASLPLVPGAYESSLWLRKAAP